MSYSSLAGPALDAWAAKKPGCYGKAVDDCVQLRPSTYSDCKLLTDAYNEDWDATDEMVQAMPFCEATCEAHDTLTQTRIKLALAVAAGFVLGAVVL